MKRYLLLLLTLVLILPTLASCASSLEVAKSAETAEETAVETAAETKEEPRDPTGFAAGFSRISINPKNSVGLAGYGNTAYRRSTMIESELTASCTAVSDGENIALLYSIDVIGLSEEITNGVLRQLERELDIPPEFVLLNATHCHSAPDISSTSDDAIVNYLRIFYPAMLQVAKEAIADLDRCEMKMGRTNTSLLNYVRRCFRSDGSLVADCVINLSTAPVVRHETDADTQVQLLRFERVNGKDILLMNWQCHVTAASGREKTVLSPDYVGSLRTKVEKEADVHFAFHQGAAANIEPNSYIESEPDNRDYKKHGSDLAKVVLGALDQMEPVASGPVRAVKKTVTCQNDLDVSMYNLAEAQEIATLSASNQFEQARNLCIKYGYNSPYHANAAVNRSKRTETETDIPISALAIGEVGFAAAPYEMFDTNGMQIKDGSPFTMTFVCAYSGGRNGYIPSEIAWESGGYEVDTCRFVKGTGEMLVGEFLTLLSQLKAN